MSFPVQFLLVLQGDLTVKPDLPAGSSIALALSFLRTYRDKRTKLLTKANIRETVLIKL